MGAYLGCTIREERSQDKWAQRARGGEKRNPAPPAGKGPPGGGNAPPPDENGLQAEDEMASGGDAEGVSGRNGSGGDCRAKRLLQKEKEVQPHPDDDKQLQDEEQPRAPQNHAGGAWRYRACVDMVHGKIEAIVMKREVKCQFSRPPAYAPTQSSDAHPVSDGQRRGKEAGIQRARMRVEKRKLPKGESKVPLLRVRPLAAGSEFLRDRRHPRAPHEEVQYAEHATRDSKGKGTKARRDARTAGRARQRIRAQRRDARAVVLRLMRVAVAGGGDRGRGGVGETEEERERTRRSGGRWTEEWCVWRANEKERGEDTSTKETQLAMEGKYGGRAQRNRGRGEEGWTTRAKITKGSAKRVVEGEVKRQDAVPAREGGSRAAREGEEGGGERDSGGADVHCDANTVVHRALWRVDESRRDEDDEKEMHQELSDLWIAEFDVATRGGAHRH
ncbi:hypothetical protein DFH09DRAFT_1094949 [Mycena vulgaris]|nr:hypothetical protein DFH09DRAFT_1094949 [Mycena vulgaris]